MHELSDILERTGEEPPKNTLRPTGRQLPPDFKSNQSIWKLIKKPNAAEII